MSAALSMRELIGLTGCHHFVLIRIYIDDSADQKRQKAIVAGAFSGDYLQWKNLAGKWRKRLKQDGLNYFRSTEYYSLRGEFFRYRDKALYPKPRGSEAARLLRDDLDIIIKESNVRGFAHCIPLEIYNEVRATERHAAVIFPEDPFEAALQSLIRDCAQEFKKHFGTQHRLAFVCDDSPSSTRIAEVYAAFKEHNPEFADILGGLAHLDDKKFPPLQAADLIAHLAREVFTEDLDHLDAPNPTAMSRLQGSVYFVRHWNRDVMLRLLEAGRKFHNLS